MHLLPSKTMGTACKDNQTPVKKTASAVPRVGSAITRLSTQTWANECNPRFCNSYLHGTTIISTMRPSRKWQLLVSLLAFIAIVPHLSAMVAEGRLYHGRVVQCLHGGAWIGQRNLGVYTRAQIYKEQVFTGTVHSVVEISFTDRRLQIVPDEVLLGDASGEITATMNQACLRENSPEIKAGDKWLFFLRTLYRDAIPYNVVDFDSPAQPVSLAQYDICLLRLRTDIDESCIALMPARRLDPPSFCPPWKVTRLFTNPLPRSSPLLEPEIKLAHISPPPEFGAHDGNGGSAAGPTFQPRGWPFSCSPDDD